MSECMRLLGFLAAVSGSIVPAATASAAECQKIAFPDSVKAGDADLVLNGLGIRKATMLNVKVYVAGLYLPQKSTDAGQILGSDQPWRLVLRFMRDVDASDIRDAFDEGFEKTAGEELEAMRKRIEALNAEIMDFKEGHYLAYGYDPATGSVVDVNGATGAPIEGADFANALLAISIGKEPPNEDLKSGLLGGACE